jgi:hypothetical protein
VFFDDFEGTLVAWTGVANGPHSGAIVGDPFQADKALRFDATTLGGDIFTSSTFTSPAGQWLLEFDYVGTCTSGGCGGFIGFSQGLPGTHTWLAGSDTTSGAAPILTNTGSWVHYSILFTASGPIHLMLEDFNFIVGTGENVAQDAYFDNISLTAVPVPAAVWLLGSALLGVSLVARRRVA